MTKKITEVNNVTKPRKNRWYLGGVAGCMAIFFTHPLDLLKVHLQTQTTGKLGLLGMCKNVVENEGVLGLYAGLSAAQLRQITYTTSRFGIYEVCSSSLKTNQCGNIPFYQKLAIGAISGFVAGIVGNPADMVNVRMQNDVKLPKECRRNYKNAIDGLYKVARYENPLSLFNGATMTGARGLLMTVGQIAFYDQTKQMLLDTEYFKDNIPTHFLSSFFAGTIATILTQPFDVLKTRLMNAKKGEYKNLASLIYTTRQEGVYAFYKVVYMS